jgi:transposase
MSLQWQLSREISADTMAIGQVLFPESDFYRQLGDRFNELFPEESAFEGLHAPTGPGVIPRLLLGLVTVFQMPNQAPDRRAAAWVVSRLDWKYALHLPLTYTGFHFSNLNHFRTLLVQNQQERRLFEELLAKLQGAGQLKKRGKTRTDSTHLLALVQRLSQLELVTESLRGALRAVAEIADAWFAQNVPVAYQVAYSQRQAEYGLSAAEIQHKLRQAGQDGLGFLVLVDQAAPVRQLAAVTVLRTVLAQQFPHGADQPALSQRPSGQPVLESPHEPEARYATKRGRSWIGYKIQVTDASIMQQEVRQAWEDRAIEAQGKIWEDLEPELARRQYEMTIAQRLLSKAQDEAGRETWQTEVDVLQMFVVNAENDLAEQQAELALCEAMVAEIEADLAVGD